MANDTQITVVGNLVEDPTLRFTHSGAPVANLTVACAPRRCTIDTPCEVLP